MHMKTLLMFFVTAPAWKIFSLFIFPILLFFFFADPSNSMLVSKTLLLFSLWTTLLWLYSIGTFIYEKYESYLSIPLGRFKACIFYDLVYSAIFVYDVIPFDYLYPFHLVSSVCNIYSLYFISRLIVMVEKQGPVKFRDYFGTFIAAWFYIIGLWYIQPRVNNIFLSDDM